MGTLYVVPTPIGNLEDVTLRALRLLREASLIAAEDTRTTRHLLTHYAISTPLISYHEHNKLSRLDAILAALATGDVALVSDAGTPGLSDPGYELIRAALEAGFTVCPLPGPSALLPALVASGLPTDGFLYLGFLPRRSTERRAALEAIQALPFTLVFYEAPHRLLETLDDLYAVLGDRQVVAAREITKLYEEFVRGSARELILHFNLNAPRGEFVLLVGGFKPPESVRWNEEHVRTALAERLAAGEPRSAAAKAIAAESGWGRREVYSMDVG
ncbi:MAG: 16S rRNA (cytidine(1402)-2'-O)-methyltransferase [Anaerolineae bacterium]|nr:16S rRNA (cytidine(1402)-2'-O)-methyltransferase [Anaerolineae bacterium]